VLLSAGKKETNIEGVVGINFFFGGKKGFRPGHWNSTQAKGEGGKKGAPGGERKRLRGRDRGDVGCAGQRGLRKRRAGYNIWRKGNCFHSFEKKETKAGLVVLVGGAPR